MPSNDEIVKQSQAAYGQWAAQWREHATFHARYNMKPMLDFQNVGIGKAILAIATGPSFQKNIDTIRENAEHCDIICVDKSLKACIENGITPTYCLVCDANVSALKYLDPVRNSLQNTTLFINVCANPKWTTGGNWKDIRFFINKDVLKSEREFEALSGCSNAIPAATNVSNAQIVLLTQSDNDGPRNFFGYDKILMIGYDYCWSPKSYYAFDATAGGKMNYMRNVYLHDLNMEFCYTSQNLYFSARWIDKYIKAYRLPVYQTSRNSILEGAAILDNLGEQMRYSYRPGDSALVNAMLSSRREMSAKIAEINASISKIGRDHHLALMRSV